MTTNHSSRPDNPVLAKVWDAGYAYGFDDNRIDYWQRGRYSALFLLGYDTGKAEIDDLVEEAIEARQRDGEWL